jgi:putative phage-type endonuclease
MRITGTAAIQGTDEWLELRKTHVGASEIAVIMGVSPFATPLELWREKRGLAKRKGSASMEKGREMETWIMSELEGRTLELYLPSVMVSDEHPLFLASLDGISADGKTIVEIKMCNREVFDKARAGEVVEWYRLQVQHQLMVSGADMAYFFCYSPGYKEYACVEVYPCRKTWARIVEAGTEFMKLVTSGTPPAMVSSDTAFETAEEFRSIEEELANVQEQKRQLDAEEKRLKDSLINWVVDNHGENRTVKGSRFTISKGTRTTYDYKKACEDNGVLTLGYEKKTEFYQVRNLA